MLIGSSGAIKPMGQNSNVCVKLKNDSNFFFKCDFWCFNMFFCYFSHDKRKLSLKLRLFFYFFNHIVVNKE